MIGLDECMPWVTLRQERSEPGRAGRIPRARIDGDHKRAAVKVLDDHRSSRSYPGCSSSAVVSVEAAGCVVDMSDFEEWGP